MGGQALTVCDQEVRGGQNEQMTKLNSQSLEDLGKTLCPSFFQGQYTQGTALLATATVMAALPVVVLHFLMQRQVIKGKLEGAVKQ